MTLTYVNDIVRNSKIIAKFSSARNSLTYLYIFVIMRAGKMTFIFLFLLFYFAMSVSGAEQHHISLSTPSSVDGIQWNRANSIYIDNSGSIWTSTESGLCRITSRGSVAYLLGGDYPKGFSTIDIRNVCGDGDSLLFVCGTNNIGKIDLKKMVFHEIADHGARTICFSNNYLYLEVNNKILKYSTTSGTTTVFASLPDNSEITTLSCFKNNLWAGTSDGHVYKFDKNGQIIFNYFCRSRVNEIYFDSKENIWIGTISSGITFIGNNGVIKTYEYKDKDASGIDSNFVRCFCEDNSGKIWIGTFEGLNLYDEKSDSFIHHRFGFFSVDSISNKSICSLVKDSQGTIWVGTYFGGLYYFNPDHNPFTEYHQGDNPESGLSSPVISSMAEDCDGNIWIATRGGGLNMLDRNTGSFKWYSYERGKRSTKDNISTVYFDFNKNEFWIGTNVSGLYSFNLETNTTRAYRNSPHRTVSVLPFNNKILLGTDIGLFLFDPAADECKKFLMGREGDTQPKKINSLLCDKKGNIWIGTQNMGLFIYSPKTNSLTQHISNVLSGGYQLTKTTDIFESSDGTIWVGTPDHGVALFSLSGNPLQNINSDNNGLASNSIIGITESPHTGKVLICTTNGLSIVDPYSNDVVNLNQNNGFPISLTRCRPLVTTDGTVFVCSANALVSFNEDDLNFSPVKYNVFFTDLHVNGKKVLPGDDSGILENGIQYTPRIILQPSMSSFSIDFASSNFIASNSSGFEYRMKGLSHDWIAARPHDGITYSNLPAGNYVLQVRASGPAKDLCEPIELEITIKPFWYKTKLAQILYFIFAGFCLYLVIAFFISRRRVKDVEALSQEKMQFFTSISHEIRTPVTIIISEIESMMKGGKFTPSLYKKLLTIYKNSFSLNNLVNELLEFRKQEHGSTSLHVTPNDIVNFVSETSLLFIDFAQSKKIKLNFRSDIERLEVWYDQRLMNKVLNNILSNALKFTEADGEVDLHVYSESGMAIIEVADTGSGIPEKELKNIFKRFYQVKNSSENTGTGIGLALALSIVKLHSGDITVNSEVGKGSCFKIILPLGYNHFSKEQLISSVQTNVISNDLTEPDNTISELDGERRKIVIAEDNEDIRNLLIELFSPHYEVFPAKDGVQAMNLIKEEMPSIVLSDVMMPNMTGTELCWNIKKDIDICHIPIVLLTAVSSVEQNLIGLKNGADDYIVKPFHSDLLISRCENLVNSRILLKDKFQTDLSTSTLSLATNSIDKDFIDKASDIIYRNLDNCDFDMLSFAKELALSKSAFFKKIRSISGQTPNDFVQTIRLKESAKLLITNPEMNINEVSEHTGFGSPQYFSKCFKKRFGQSPLSYRNKYKKQ